ncbi:MAG: hypothetical protein U0599_03820 [Vicinamibacteria bacterium]
MARRAEDAGDLLGPVGILVDDRDVPERSADRPGDHRSTLKAEVGPPRRSIDVKRFTIERSAARRSARPEVRSPPASRPARRQSFQVALGGHEDDQDLLVHVAQGPAHG